MHVHLKAVFNSKLDLQSNRALLVCLEGSLE